VRSEIVNKSEIVIRSLIVNGSEIVLKLLIVIKSEIVIGSGIVKCVIYGHSIVINCFLTAQ